MHLNITKILRWLVISGFGGYGIYLLINGILHVLPKPEVHWAFFWFFMLPFMFVFSGLFIAVAYFVLRRQYGRLGKLVSVFAAFVVFSFLLSLPNRLDLPERLYAWVDSPWANLIVLPLMLILLLFPFYGAGWVYRRGQAFLLRFIHDDTSHHMPPNHALGGGH